MNKKGFSTEYAEVMCFSGDPSEISGRHIMTRVSDLRYKCPCIEIELKTDVALSEWKAHPVMNEARPVASEGPFLPLCLNCNSQMMCICMGDRIDGYCDIVFHCKNNPAHIISAYCEKMTPEVEQKWTENFRRGMQLRMLIEDISQNELDLIDFTSLRREISKENYTDPEWAELLVTVNYHHSCGVIHNVNISETRVSYEFDKDIATILEARKRPSV